MIKHFLSIFTAVLCLCSGMSAQNYRLGKITAKRIEVTKALDGNALSRDAEAFLVPYKAKVDSFIGPVIGKSEQFMIPERPESLLSNWAADVLLFEANARCGNKKGIDFSVINIGGLRSAMPLGDVRRGDIIDIAPFQNTLVILTLKGSDVIDLFTQFGIYGGEGVSHGVQITYNSDMTLAKASINGKKIKKNKLYRVATLDYLAEGNDNMKALRNAVARDNTGVFIRQIYIDHIKNLTAGGKTIKSEIEGRTVILPK